MPRMFDILKGKDEDGGKDARKKKTPEDMPAGSNAENAGKEAEPLSFPKEILKSDISDGRNFQDHSLVSKKLISAVKKHGVDNQEKADEIYETAVNVVKSLLEKIRAGEDLNQFMDRLHGLLNDVFNQLVMGDNILNNIYEKGREDYFLPYHIVNALILSSVLGLNMGFNKSRLSHLGLAGLFYDAGMEDLSKIVKQPRALTKEEYGAVKGHIGRSLEIVDKIDAVNEIVKETILTHHERVDGTGYPRGIKYDAINPYARILGLVDTYEAITHMRPYREGLNTHHAVRFMIISLKNRFDADVMKIFINKMSVYPIGSLVRLDTDEIARVISVQPGSPLRPVVMILRDMNGENVSERIIIDLSRQDVPSIKDSVSL